MLLQTSSTAGTRDQCACRCLPHGVVATIAVNVLLWTAVVLSGGAVLDCHMVEADVLADDGANWPALPDTLLGLVDAAAGDPTTDRRGFGLFIHEDANGDCRWEYWGDRYDDSQDWTDEDEDEVEDYILEYADWMGRDWRRAAKVGASTFGLGFALTAAAGVYGCVAHVRPIRWITGCVTLLVMSMQFAVLSARNSDFCRGRNCELKRSGHLAVAAGMLYLVAALCFFFMKNYPGRDEETIDSKGSIPTGVVVEEEMSHPDDNVTYTVDYSLGQDVEGQRASPDVGQGHDGLSDAHEIKAAQIY